MRPQRVVAVTGPPGAGKTTALLDITGANPALARFGVRDFGLELAARGHPLGLEMRETLLQQGLLSNDLVARELAHYLDHVAGRARGIFVEGYPRDPAQAAGFERVVAEWGGHLVGYAVVDVPDEVVRRRVARRRLCRGCGLPVDDHGADACPRCGGAVVRRLDDDADRLERRLADYRLVSAPVRAYFAERGLLRPVDGLLPPAEVRRRLEALVLPAPGPGPRPSPAHPKEEMMIPTTSMMDLRRTRLSALGQQTPRADEAFSRFRLPLAGYEVQAGRPGVVPPSLTEAIADRLFRDDASSAPGAAVVTGLGDYFDLDQARSFHEALFPAVWEAFRRRHGAELDGSYRVKAGIISDGAIPVELYGSAWSFKQLHIDRDVLLFSHLYGPVAGFTGGNLLLIDIQPYMSTRSLSFDDLFQWSEEPTEGSKPVLREEFAEKAFAEGGIDCGAIGPDEIVFVNNMPAAGILHGVTPVTVTDPATFRRDYHRCSAKQAGR